MRNGIVNLIMLCFGLSAVVSADPQMESEMRSRASEKVHWTKPDKKKHITHVQILSINDFHGQITSGKKVSGRDVGSAPVLITYFKEEQKRFDGPTFIVHAGDFVGASVPESALLQDEPAIMILNSVADKSYNFLHRKNRQLFNVIGIPGNHEFDEGLPEFFRMLNGGNHVNGPFLEKVYKGASFPYICANITYKQNNETILPPYVIRKVHGSRIAFIGATTKETPLITSPAGVSTLNFNDEVTAINQVVENLSRKNIHAFVVVIHQGGFQTAYDGLTKPDATQLSGPIVDIVSRLNSDVDVVITGHAHGFTNALIPNAEGAKILVTQAWSSGTAYGDIELEIDRETNDIVSKSAWINTTWADTAFRRMPDPESLQIVTAAQERVAPLVNQVIARASTDILRTQNAAGESALGNLIADAQRAAMGTDFAMTNPGGIRADLSSGEITWGDLYTIQPFNNNLVKMQLTGQQIYDVLNQQWKNQSDAWFMQISGFSYSWDVNRPLNDRVTEVLKDGSPIDLQKTYSLTVNSFLASGGDSFTVFTKGLNQEAGQLTLEALIEYTKKMTQPVSIGIEGRIKMIE